MNNKGDYKMLTIKGKIEELKMEILKHDKIYEAGDNTLISDSEYDQLFAELVRLEKENPELITEDSPTQKVITVFNEELKKVKHSVPMLSQEKAHTEDDIRKFLERVLEAGDILVQQKLDGLTAVLKYQNRKLTLAATRGDGEFGEVIYGNIISLETVPQLINFEGSFEIRAEAIIPFANFDRINEELIVSGQEPYSNPRNLVSGSVRTLDTLIAKERGVQLIAFETIEVEGMFFENDTERIEFAKNLGFTFVDTKVFTKDEVDGLMEYLFNYNEKVRPTLPHLIDGLVLKTNNLSKREELGSTSKYPKWAIALKFPSIESTTILTDVVWTVGPSGKLTPNAVLVPVKVDKSTVSGASLANIDNIRQRDIRIGDNVAVKLANDVIPQVTRSIPAKRTGKEKEVEIPTNCPVCNSVVEVEGWEITCVNPNCEAQLKRRLEKFVSRDGLNINGLGEKTIDLLYEEGLIRNYPDIYELKNHTDKILELQGFAKKGMDKMLQGIEESKNAPLSKVLFAINIQNCGKGTSKRMANHFKTMTKILSYNEIDLKEQLLSIDDIGEIVADGVVKYFMNEANRNMIKFILSVGFTAQEEVEEVITVEGISGKIFVVTGALEGIGRKDIEKLIESKGGKVSGSVSKKTNYLVLGGYNHLTGEGLDLTSGKSKKAHEVGTVIISQEQLNELLG